MDEFNATSLLDEPESPTKYLSVPKTVVIIKENDNPTLLRSQVAKGYIEERYKYILELEQQKKVYNPLHAARHVRKDFKRDLQLPLSKVHKLDIKVQEMRKAEYLQDLKATSIHSFKSLESISDIYDKSRSPSIQDTHKSRQSIIIPHSETAPSLSLLSSNNASLIKFKLALNEMTFVSSEMKLIVSELEQQTLLLSTKIDDDIDVAQSLLLTCRKASDLESTSNLKSPLLSTSQLQETFSLDAIALEQEKWYDSVDKKDFTDIKMASFEQQLFFWKFHLIEINQCLISQSEQVEEMLHDIIYYKQSSDDLSAVIYDLYGAMINQMEYLFQYAIKYSKSEPLTDVALGFVEFIIPIIGFLIQIVYKVGLFFKKKLH